MKMSFPSNSGVRRSRFLAILAVMVLGLRVPLPATAQERPGEEKAEPGARKGRERELDDIKRELETLRRRVGELEQAPAPAREPAGSQPREAILPAEWAKSLKWRSIGPAGMGGRITGIAVHESDPTTWWIATASGGLLKTVNNGVTYEHQFDHESTVSIGAVAVAPSDKEIVWVGTGEANPRNSVSYGDGVYKSVDGGKSWTRMGLEKSFQIGSIAIHPSNPDVVYVGALGRLYGPSEERGLYRTSDGGRTFERILHFDDRTGVIDIAMSPKDPETLIVSMWDRQRDLFDSHRGNPPVPEGYDGYDPARKWGPHAGLYKTSDGGRTFKRLAAGLPSGMYGRCDVDWYRKDPNVVYAIVDCEKIGMGPAPSRSYLGVSGEDAEDGVRLTRVAPHGPADKAGLRVDDVVTALEGGKVTSWAALSEGLRLRQPGDVLALVVRRDDASLGIEARLEERPLSAVGAGPAAAFLGLGTGEVTDGLKVTDVTGGSPADRAGVRPDDILKSMDDEPLTGNELLTELVRVRRPADRIRLEVVRGTETLVLDVTLGERAGGAGGGGVGAFGRRGGGGGGVLAGYFGAAAREREGGGVELARVAEDQPAERAGLAEGDLVLEIDGTAVTSVEELVEIVGSRKEGDTITIKYEREKEAKETRLALVSTDASRLRPFGYMYAGQMPNVQDKQGPDGHEYGGIYRSADAGETWKRINSLDPRPMYFSQIRVDPSDERYLYVAGVSLHRSTNGGKTFTADAGSRVHADFHAIWIDPRDGRHLLVGCDGGFYVSWDRSRNWEHLNSMALGQFYHVCVDSRRPYRVYGGLQDNGSWGGPSRALDGSGILNEDWISVGGGDGFVCRTDPFDPEIVYSESQDGNIARRDLRTGESVRIAPRPKRGVRYRFNWNTPFVLSAHNAGILYCGGNFVFRSLKRGEDLRPISPEITRTGRGSASAIAESPMNADVLWVGTDDGYVWVTKDGGGHWVNVTDRIGLPGARWVATLEPSRHVEGRCLVAFDAHRSDDDQPYVYATEDFGETWQSLRSNLPAGSTRCLREDPKNKDLLYCGTEFAAWASLDRGGNWTKINGNLPTVAIHEFAFHPESGEVVVATHGRSLWIADVAPLRQMTAQAVQAAACLYEPNPVVRWHSNPSRGTGTGMQRFVGENPPRGAQIAYSLTKKAERATIRILDYSGKVVRELEGKTAPGLHVATWDLSVVPPRPERRGEGAPSARPEREPAEGARGETGPRGRRERGVTPRTGGEAPEGERAAPGATVAEPAARPAARPGRTGPVEAPAGGNRGFGGRRAPLGTYRVILEVDGKDFEKALRIEGDPALPAEVAARIGLEEEPSSSEDDEEEEELREAMGAPEEGEEEESERPGPVIR